MRLALSALLLAAPAALAQDLSAQFAGAARAFTLPGTASLGITDLAQDDAVMALLPRLAGDWVALNVLFPDPLAYDPDLVARACERNASTLIPVAARSFEMRRTAEQDGTPVSLSVRYDWVIGNSFDRGVAEEELVAYLGLGALDEIPVAMLAAPHLRGPAQVFHPGADMLVILAPQQPPELWGRCPA